MASRSALRGTVAVEFALLLPVLVLIIYALTVYAIIFAAQHTLVQASAEGARAALRHGTTAQREAAACQVARNAATWIRDVTGAEPSCAVDAVCGDPPCRRVLLRYDYLAAPLVPTPPLMSALVPAQLQSSAVVHFIP